MAIDSFRSSRSGFHLGVSVLAGQGRWPHRDNPCQRRGNRFRRRFRGLVQVLLGAVEGISDTIEKSTNIDRVRRSQSSRTLEKLHRRKESLAMVEGLFITKPN